MINYHYLCKISKGDTKGCHFHKFKSANVSKCWQNISRQIYSMIQYENVYKNDHHWYDMIFFSKYLSTIIWYEYLIVFVIIHDIWWDSLKTKFYFPWISHISNNKFFFDYKICLLFALKYHFQYDMIFF